jgi:hypothetical protein
MIHGRMVALALAALLAGCSASGSVTPPAPQQQVAPPLAGSSAARIILANAGLGGAASRSPQGWGGGDDDDGDRGLLQLPVLKSCGGGTFATDCSVWVFGSGGGPTRDAARSAQSVAAGAPPALNFCRDGGSFPADLGAPATPPQLLGATYSFSLTYAGTKSPPIVSFVTRAWNLDVQGTFAASATTASIRATPTLLTGASRGWLVFFTWTWPADILLIPYEINEIQLAASSSPLLIPAGGSAPLGAFDCLGRKITARVAGSGFGFNHNLSAGSLTSATSELNVPVFAGSRPSGFVYLTDDRGAQVAAPVGPAQTPNR